MRSLVRGFIDFVEEGDGGGWGGTLPGCLRSLVSRDISSSNTGGVTKLNKRNDGRSRDVTCHSRELETDLDYPTVEPDDTDELFKDLGPRVASGSITFPSRD